MLHPVAGAPPSSEGRRRVYRWAKSSYLASPTGTFRYCGSSARARARALSAGSPPAHVVRVPPGLGSSSSPSVSAHPCLTPPLSFSFLPPPKRLSPPSSSCPRPRVDPRLPISGWTRGPESAVPRAPSSCTRGGAADTEPARPEERVAPAGLLSCSPLAACSPPALLGGSPGVGGACGTPGGHPHFTAGPGAASTAQVKFICAEHSVSFTNGN